MLDHILIETIDEKHHNTYEVEHTGKKILTGAFVGGVAEVENRLRWEYRKRFNRGTLSIQYAAQQTLAADDDNANN